MAEAQTTREAERPEPPRIDEADRLKLHNLILQRQVFEERLNGLIFQFLQSGEARHLQAAMQRLSIEIDAVSARLFADAGLDPKGYQLSVEQGRFHEREA